MGTQEREEGPATYDDTARPQHRVTITNPFYLGKYPVTRREYATFVQATGQRWPGKSAQRDKWIFCLRAARIAAEQEQT